MHLFHVALPLLQAGGVLPILLARQNPFVSTYISRGHRRIYFLETLLFNSQKLLAGHPPPNKVFPL